jgi:hypothetical protein
LSQVFEKAFFFDEEFSFEAQRQKTRSGAKNLPFKIHNEILRTREGWKRHPFAKRSGAKDTADSPTAHP